MKLNAQPQAHLQQHSRRTPFGGVQCHSGTACGSAGTALVAAVWLLCAGLASPLHAAQPQGAVVAAPGVVEGPLSQRALGLIVRLRRSSSPAGTFKGSGSDAARDAQAGMDAVHSPRLKALGMEPTLGQALAGVDARLAAAGGSFRLRRALRHDTLLVDLEKPTTVATARALAAQLAADPQVQFAVPDVPVQPADATPSVAALPSSAFDSAALALRDPQAFAQWPLYRTDDAGLGAQGGNPGGAGLAALWPLTRGAGIGIAVIDTGITRHADLENVGVRGHDFIGADPDGRFQTANDGDGRDSDPSDPGNDCSREGAPSTVSTWHGTQVAGLLAAQVGNGLGIVGAAPEVRVRSLRVMGRCGGRSSDVVDAIRWAAGRSVPGVPDNPEPARIINLSLSTAWSYRCDAAMQDAVDEAMAAGALIVAAAGNDAASAQYPAQGGVSAPANCAGVVAVGAHTRSGDRALYGNHGAAIALTAPGGGACALQSAAACMPDGLVTTSNSGRSAPAADWYQPGFSGTSAATPHVAAAAALLWSLRPELTPAQMAGVLGSGARAWPADSWCSTPQANGHCGAGMLDVQASAEHLRGPLISIEPVRNAVAGTSRIALRATAHSDEHSPRQLRYEWFIGSSMAAAMAVPSAQITGLASTDTGPASAPVGTRSAALATASGGVQVVTLSEADSPTPTLTATAARADIAVALRVTDPAGRSAWATTHVTVDNAPVFDALDAVRLSAGQVLDVQARAVDPDGDAVHYALVEGPAGVVVDPVSGRVSWNSPVHGAHTIRVGAQDDLGASAATLGIEVRVGQDGADDARGPGGGGAIDGRSLLLFLALIALALMLPGRSRR